MPGDLGQALQLAQDICWDEGYGYGYGFHFADHTNGGDCGGLVFHCLNAAGYSVRDESPGTSNMGPLLIAAGFDEYQYDSSFTPQHGDIFVMNTTGHGHTFFYCEDILHYTDPSGRTAGTGSTGSCKVEASSSRTSGYSYADGDPGTIPGDVNNPAGSGDYPRNGVGAYWEVWAHSYSSLVYSPYSDSDVKVYRDPNFDPTDPSGSKKDMAALLCAILRHHKPRWKRF